MEKTGKAKAVSVEPLDNANSKWLKLVKVTYNDSQGETRSWEAVKRTTRPANSAVDAIIIVAVLDKPDSGSGPELLLEKQYRPPADKYVIEFPAGLVDEGETAEQAAVRELREETGYVGEVLPDRRVSSSGGGGGGDATRPVYNGSPATSSSTAYMMHMKIDLSLPQNKNPKPELEASEDIECFTVPLRDLYAEIRNLEKSGYAIDGKVGAFVEGLEVASQFSFPRP